MAIGGGNPPRGLVCPACGDRLEPTETAGNGSEGDRAHRLVCPNCNAVYRARRRDDAGDGERPPAAIAKPAPPPTTAGFDLIIRSAMVRALAWSYPVGVKLGACLLIPLGGFVPVLSGWMRDEVRSWGGVVEALGGVWHAPATRDPEADLGPILARLDAPNLFQEIAGVARRLGVRPPDQVRLSYLPCCGVVAWRRSRILIVGLPLLQVLTISELRAVLAHELAHLARGDATHTARASRYIEGLAEAIEGANGKARGPLRWWALGCRSTAKFFAAPIARGQETRADKVAASVAGGGAAASALVKVAMVQPLFREVLNRHDPNRDDLPNLYALFRTFWRRLPDAMREAMRLQLLVNTSTLDDSPHPPLPERLAVIQSYPDPHETAADRMPASSALCDLEAFEQLLHNRLFGGVSLERTVFHRAGT